MWFVDKLDKVLILQTLSKNKRFRTSDNEAWFLIIGRIIATQHSKFFTFFIKHLKFLFKISFSLYFIYYNAYTFIFVAMLLRKHRCSTKTVKIRGFFIILPK